MSWQGLSATAILGKAVLWSYLQIRHSIVEAMWIALGWSFYLRVEPDSLFLTSRHRMKVLGELSIRRVHHK